MKGKVLIPPRFLIVAETMAKKKKTFSVQEEENTRSHHTEVFKKSRFVKV
jgi:hypothetical protein